MTPTSPRESGIGPPLLKGSEAMKGKVLRFLGVLLLAGLLFAALHNAPLMEIWAALQKLQLWQILVILSVDLLIYMGTSARWWFIANVDEKRVNYFALIPVRISAFAISYFTFGPQVGGEPLQVLYLQRQYGFTYTRAASTVVMDKLLEFLASFCMLVFAFNAVLQTGLLASHSAAPLTGLLALALVVGWPLVHIALLYTRHYPLTDLMRLLPFLPKEAKAVRFIRAAEWMAGRFCRRHFTALLASFVVSLLAAFGTIAEYMLMISFLEIRLPFWGMVSAWAAGWLSFLVPLPGGLGALEASQVFAFGALGLSAPLAISVVLLMRGRDLLIGGLGLMLAGRSIGR